MPKVISQPNKPTNPPAACVSGPRPVCTPSWVRVVVGWVALLSLRGGVMPAFCGAGDFCVVGVMWGGMFSVLAAAFSSGWT